MSSGRYDELAAKVDAFHARVDQRHPGALTCRAGCSQCCHQHLTVLPLEMARITQAVRALPEAERLALRARVEAGPGADPRCVLLDDDGRCRTYAARPLICRSHGLPVQVQDDGGARRDVCPLNFPEGPPVEALDADVVLDVERLSGLLVLLDRFEAGGRGERIDLFAGVAAALEP